MSGGEQQCEIMTDNNL